MNNAFFNEDLHKDVFMVQPKGYEMGDGKLVCKLIEGLYGLT